nr:unnamed protein product [Digitaria exilis]
MGLQLLADAPQHRRKCQCTSICLKNDNAPN